MRDQVIKRIKNRVKERLKYAKQPRVIILLFSVIMGYYIVIIILDLVYKIAI